MQNFDKASILLGFLLGVAAVLIAILCIWIWKEDN